MFISVNICTDTFINCLNNPFSGTNAGTRKEIPPAVGWGIQGVWGACTGESYLNKSSI